MRLFLAVFSFLQFKSSFSKPLNIIIILADDLGWNDVSFHGSNQIFTPNIDSLAYNGIVLNQFYTQSTCTPSRAALLTGKYPIRLGFQGYPLLGGENRTLPLNTLTLAEELKKLGYKNHLVGKWHLGSPCLKNTPTKRGFDTFFGYYNGYIGYYDYKMRQNDFIGFDFRNNTEPLYEVYDRYAHDILVERSIEIIERHDESKPLFLMVSHLAPHTGENGTELTVKNETEADLNFAFINDKKRRKYAAIVKQLDESVSQVVKALNGRNLLKDSVIFFLSDNGGQTYGMHENKASNWPFKGQKFTILNGGVRVPSIIYSPKLPNGIINNGLVHIVDLFKTIITAAGGDCNSLTNVDSISIWEHLKNGATTSRKEMLLELDEYMNVFGFISGDYKLVKDGYLNGKYQKRSGERGRDLKNPNYDIQKVLNSQVNKILAKYTENVLTKSKIIDMRNRLDFGRIGFEDKEFNCSELCLFNLKDDPLETTNIANEFQRILDQLWIKINDFKSFVVHRNMPSVDDESDPIFFNGTWSYWLENTTKCM